MGLMVYKFIQKFTAAKLWLEYLDLGYLRKTTV